VLPFWHARIAPELRTGRDVLVVAHGNSLRAMVKMLDRIAASEIVELNIPTACRALRARRELQPGQPLLGDPQAIAAAGEAVRRQTKSVDAAPHLHGARDGRAAQRCDTAVKQRAFRAAGTASRRPERFCFDALPVDRFTRSVVGRGTPGERPAAADVLHVWHDQRMFCCAG